MILTGIYLGKNLLCFYSDICNKRFHTIKYIHTSISIASYCSLPINQFRHQEKAMKWVVLRIEIAASPEI